MTGPAYRLFPLALALLVALPAQAQVRISCDRGPLKKVSIINGPSRAFIQSILDTYDVTLDQATQVATQVCSDVDAADEPERLVKMTIEALKGYRLR